MHIPALLASQKDQITEFIVLENVAAAVQQRITILLIRASLESIHTVQICLHITKSFTFAELALFPSDYCPTSCPGRKCYGLGTPDLSSWRASIGSTPVIDPWFTLICTDWIFCSLKSCFTPPAGVRHSIPSPRAQLILCFDGFILSTTCLTHFTLYI